MHSWNIWHVAAKQWNSFVNKIDMEKTGTYDDHAKGYKSKRDLTAGPKLRSANSSTPPSNWPGKCMIDKMARTCTRCSGDEIDEKSGSGKAHLVLAGVQRI